MIWSIAWRNVWRNKVRSIIIILAITVGLTGGILSYGFMLGFMQQRIDAAIDNEISNIQIHHPSYLMNEEIKFQVKNESAIITEIEKLPDVKAVSSRIRTTAMASTASTGTGVIINGIDHKKEREVTNIHKLIEEGSYLDEKDKIPIIIGRKLAIKLNAKIKSKIVITVANKEGVITYGAFRVKGIYHTENDLFDEVNVFVKKTDLSKLLGLNNHAVHEIAISLFNNNKTNQLTKEIKELYKNSIDKNQITVRPWKEITPTLYAMIEMMDYFSYIFLIIILIALAFGIVNTMMMVVMERIKELGMLKAIGMNNKRLFNMIMLETVFLSLCGGIMGLLISFGLSQYWGKYGFSLEAFKEGYNSLGFSSIVYIKIDPAFYLITTLLVIVTAIISSIYPSRKALKLDPASAIRDNN